MEGRLNKKQEFIMTKNNNVGVSLTKEICPICGKAIDGPIVMNTVLTKKEKEKVEQLNNKAIGFSKHPCEDCMKNYTKNDFKHVAILIMKSDTSKFPLAVVWSPEEFYRALPEERFNEIFMKFDNKFYVGRILLKTAHDINLIDEDTYNKLKEK